MNPELEDIELRSEEVQEILGTPPGWLARWGTVAALVGLVALGWIGFWVELPETIEADVKITSKDPPRKLYAPKTILLKEIFVENESRVDSGRTLLLFDSKAKLGHVISLEADLLRIKSDSQLLGFQPQRDLLLGEIQAAYYEFLEKWDQYHLVASRKLDTYSKREMESRVRELELSIAEQQHKRERLNRQWEDVRARYEKEQEMLNKGMLTREDLNPTRSEKDRLEREMQDLQSDIRTKNFQIATLRDKSRSDSGRAKALQDQALNLGLLKDSFVKLRNHVSEWKRTYTLEAPINGTVIFVKDNVVLGQYVQSGAMLLVVLPVTASGTVGKMELLPEEAGQVTKGQKVMVKLYDYPFPDYGAAWGFVESKGKIPAAGKIPIDIRFPGDTLVTTKAGRVLPEGEMRGKATIILSQRRLIQRLFGAGGSGG